MKRELSAEEIKLLHQFCIRHYVVQFDVRTELVDHLASSIEALWEDDNSETFVTALQKVYSNYGPTGFRKLLSEKEHAVEKAFHKGLTHAFASMFEWPNILIAGILSLICVFLGGFYKEGQTVIPALFILVFCAFSVLVDIVVSVFLYRKKKRLKEPLLSTKIHSGFFIIFLLEYAMCYRLTAYLFEPRLITSAAFPKPVFFLYCGICIVCILMSIAKYRYTTKNFFQAKLVYPMVFK